MARYTGPNHTGLFWVLVAGVVVVLLGFYFSRGDTILSPDAPSLEQAPVRSPEPAPMPLPPDPTIPEAPVLPDAPPDQVLPEQTNPDTPAIPVPPDRDPI